MFYSKPALENYGAAAWQLSLMKVFQNNIRKKPYRKIDKCSMYESLENNSL